MQIREAITLEDLHNILLALVVLPKQSGLFSRKIFILYAGKTNDSPRTFLHTSVINSTIIWFTMYSQLTSHDHTFS